MSWSSQSPQSKPPISAKIVLIGDSGVGKTSLRNRYLHNQFTLAYRATIGADFVTKTLNVGDRQVSMAIWDTAGQERFQSLGAAFYRGADACVLVFSATSKSSLEHIPVWYKQFVSRYPLLEGEERDICWVAVGNKWDSFDDPIENQNELVNPNEATSTVSSLLPNNKANTTFNNFAAATSTPNRTRRRRHGSGDTTPTITVPSESDHVSSPAQSSSSVQHQDDPDYLTRQPVRQLGLNNLSSREMMPERTPPRRGRHVSSSASVYHTPPSTGMRMPSSSRPDSRASQIYSHDTSMTSRPFSPTPIPSTSSSLSYQDFSSQQMFYQDTSFDQSTSRIQTNPPSSSLPSTPSNNQYSASHDGSSRGSHDTNNNIEDEEDEGLTSNVQLFFTSAKSGSNVENVFEYIAQQIVKRAEREEAKRHNGPLGDFDFIDEDENTPRPYSYMLSGRPPNPSIQLTNNDNEEDNPNQSNRKNSWKGSCC